MIARLPALNALLNSVSAFFLLCGFFFIRRRQIEFHKFCMLSAFTASAIFLISYITYHLHAGHVKFQHAGWIRQVYLTILTSHTILAVVIVPMVIVTLRYALKGNFESHRQIAKKTFPLWLYVSITGVIVFWMLYHF